MPPVERLGARLQLDVLLGVRHDVERVLAGGPAAHADGEKFRAAQVGLPGFDPGVFGRGITRNEYRALEGDIDRPLFNRAIRGTYPPGSTVKPVLGMAGLANGVVTADESHFCSGVYHVPGSRRVARVPLSGV